MNLDKLERIYHDGFADEQERTDGKGDLEKAGLRRVVHAIWREVVPDSYLWASIYVREVEAAFERCLAEASDEKAAGGPPSDDGHASNDTRVSTPAADLRSMMKKAAYTGGMNDLNVSTPAADPSPQCEWTDEGEWYDTPCNSEDVLMRVEGFKFCPSCGKPIVFKEPKP